MTNAEFIAYYLKSRGISHVYELTGGMITILLDAVHTCTDIKIVSMHHEQGAAFAAEGWARIKGVPGVALATSGPGAINLLTGIGSCYFDSVPAVFITGQVNRDEQKKDKPTRQLGFQETDIVTMVKPITKAAWLVENAEDLPGIIDHAFHIASSGRPGPVLVDIPMDVQRHVLSDVPALEPVTHSACADMSTKSKGRQLYLNQLSEALRRASRPLVLAGGGIRSSQACKEYRALIERLQIPAVHSLLGVDLLPAVDPLRIGMIGSYGNRWANLAVGMSDFILVLGSRLDIRQTGNDVAGFIGTRKIFHVDCEIGETNNRVKGCQAWHEELQPFLIECLNELPVQSGHRVSWVRELAQLRIDWPDTSELSGANGINPNHFMHELSRHTPYANAYVTDVGQNQMWAAQSVDLLPNQRFLTSGGMGSMGFALPASIGACIACGPTVAIAGDGGFQLNIQELQTVVRNNLPIKMVVINNHSLGMVRQFQESYFSGRYQSTMWGYDSPSFHKISAAYGIESGILDKCENIERELLKMSINPFEPYLLEVHLDPLTNVYPKLAFGRTFGEMEPMVKPIEMEGT